MLSGGVRGTKRTGLQSHEQPHIRKLAQGLGRGSGRGGHKERRHSGPVPLPREQPSYWENSGATEGNPTVCVRNKASYWSGGSRTD